MALPLAGWLGVERSPAIALVLAGVMIRPGLHALYQLTQEVDR